MLKIVIRKAISSNPQAHKLPEKPTENILTYAKFATVFNFPAIRFRTITSNICQIGMKNNRII